MDREDKASTSVHYTASLEFLKACQDALHEVQNVIYAKKELKCKRGVIPFFFNKLSEKKVHKRS